MTDKLLLTIGEACIALNTSRQSLWRMGRDNKISFVTLMKRRMVPVAEVERIVSGYRAPVGEPVAEPKTIKKRKLNDIQHVG